MYHVRFLKVKNCSIIQIAVDIVHNFCVLFLGKKVIYRTPKYYSLVHKKFPHRTLKLIFDRYPSNDV